MEYYLSINGTDYSAYVNKLQVGKEHFYKSMNTASGNTLVKYTNSKDVIEVGIIPLNDTIMAKLLTDINQFQVKATYRDPATNTMKRVDVIIPNNIVEYYTIQAGNVKYKAFSFQMKQI